MNLQKVKEVVESLLKEARKHRGDFKKDAINWGDLSCVDVRRWESISGMKGIDIWIEEAAPSCYQLPVFIQAGLAEKEIYADVRTEW